MEPTAPSKIRHEGHDRVGNHGGKLGRTSESSEPWRGESTTIYLIRLRRLLHSLPANAVASQLQRMNTEEERRKNGDGLAGS